MIDGDEQAIPGQAEMLDDQLPGERDRLFLEIIAEGKIPQHFEERVMARGITDVVRSLCLPPARTHFCDEAARVYERFSAPVNRFLNGTIPALVNIKVGSLRGTSEDEGTT